MIPLLYYCVPALPLGKVCHRNKRKSFKLQVFAMVGGDSLLSIRSWLLIVCLLSTSLSHLQEILKLSYTFIDPSLSLARTGTCETCLAWPTINHALCHHSFRIIGYSWCGFWSVLPHQNWRINLIWIYAVDCWTLLSCELALLMW